MSHTSALISSHYVLISLISLMEDDIPSLLCTAIYSCVWAFQFPGLGSSRLPRTQSSGLQSSWPLSSCSGISGICICCFVTNGVYTHCSGSDSSETPAGTTWTGPSSLVRSELHRRHILHFLAYEFLVLQEAVKAYLWPQSSDSPLRVAFWSTTTFLWVLVLTLQVRISEFTATLTPPSRCCDEVSAEYRVNIKLLHCSRTDDKSLDESIAAYLTISYLSYNWYINISANTGISSQ